jgi:hypothetical protein
MTRKEFFVLTFTLLGTGIAGVAARGGSTSGNDGTGGAGGSTGNLTCADPLPETQVPDSTGHTHTVTVPRRRSTRRPIRPLRRRPGAPTAIPT